MSWLTRHHRRARRNVRTGRASRQRPHAGLAQTAGDVIQGRDAVARSSFEPTQISGGLEPCAPQTASITMSLTTPGRRTRQ